MKLTKREKWLMQKAWDNGINRTDCNDMQEWLDIVDYGSMIESILRQAPKPESPVKTVDADNLPDGEVLMFNDKGARFLGHFNGVATNNNGVKIAFFSCSDVCNDFAIKQKGFHYIEQKDLLKLITNK